MAAEFFRKRFRGWAHNFQTLARTPITRLRTANHLYSATHSRTRAFASWRRSGACA